MMNGLLVVQSSVQAVGGSKKAVDALDRDASPTGDDRH